MLFDLNSATLFIEYCDPLVGVLTSFTFQMISPDSGQNLFLMHVCCRFDSLMKNCPKKMLFCWNLLSYMTFDVISFSFRWVFSLCNLFWLEISFCLLVICNFFWFEMSFFFLLYAISLDKRWVFSLLVRVVPLDLSLWIDFIDEYLPPFFPSIFSIFKRFC